MRRSNALAGGGHRASCGRRAGCRRIGPRALGGGRRRNQFARPPLGKAGSARTRSEEHTSELQSHLNLVCRLLLEKKNNTDKHARESEWCATVCDVRVWC